MELRFEKNVRKRQISLKRGKTGPMPLISVILRLLDALTSRWPVRCLRRI